MGPIRTRVKILIHDIANGELDTAGVRRELDAIIAEHGKMFWQIATAVNGALLDHYPDRREEIWKIIAEARPEIPMAFEKVTNHWPFLRA